MAHFHHHRHHPSHTSVSAPVFAHPTAHHHSHTRHTRPVPISSTSSTARHLRHAYAPARVHPTAAVDAVLAYNHSARPPIEFDLTLSPSQILIAQGPSRSSYAGLTQRDLSSPATTPPMAYIHIRCDDLPWSIDVYPSTDSGSGVVTVGDVLHGIYRALRRRVSSAEWDASSPGMQQRVRDAWLRRCKRQQSHKERSYESNNGLRRVDWLTKYTVFRGLSPGKSHDHWVMHVGQGEKSVKFWAGS
ncbi:hypothetical protein JB92DRAFT_2891323 [Gautieria morchelliformis]|nr:hypothetical protein JB92DRAFT_2891323 [Gautieria morchelliformis]